LLRTVTPVADHETGERVSVGTQNPQGPLDDRHLPAVPARSSLSFRVAAVAQAVALAERHGIRAWLRTGNSESFMLLGSDAIGAVQDVLQRLRAEYLEMPGLQLTAEQVQRLCGIEPMLCRLVLELLVNEEFLCVKSDRSYRRVRDGAERRHLAKAVLRTLPRATKVS
jgi:hypothetical protein